MHSIRSSLLAFAISACGGRTAFDATLNAFSSGGTSGLLATGGTAGVVEGGCARLKFQVVSTPGYDAVWCMRFSDAYEVLELSNASGPLGLDWNGVDCSGCKKTPWSMKLREYQIEGSAITWTGAYRIPSTCSSDESVCSVVHCAEPGRYQATVCGYVNPNPQWSAGCEEANDATPVFCGATEFDYPADMPVVITLRPPTG